MFPCCAEHWVFSPQVLTVASCCLTESITWVRNCNGWKYRCLNTKCKVFKDTEECAWTCMAMKHTKITPISILFLIRWKNKLVNKPVYPSLFYLPWELEAIYPVTHTCTQSLPHLTRILPTKNMLAKSRARCSRAVRMGLQPNNHKAESSVNSEEFTGMAKVFLQVQERVFCCINQVAQLSSHWVPNLLKFCTSEYHCFNLVYV